MFCAITIAVSYGIVSHGLAPRVLLLLIVPIIFAAMIEYRYVYLSMLAAFLVSSLVTTEILWIPDSEVASTVIGAVIAALVASEGIRLFARRQVRLSSVQESEERLRAFLENAPDAIIVVDESGSISEINKSACLMIDDTYGDLIGQRFETYCTDERTVVLGTDNIPRWTGNLQRNDGTTLSVEMSKSKFDLHGETSWIVIARDIEERTRAENELRRSEAIRRSIIESTSDYLLMLGLDYRIQFANRTVPDLTVEGVVGRSVLEYIHPDLMDDTIACYERIVATGEPGTLESTYISNDDDEEHYFESRIAPILEDGKVAGFILSSSDVTERRQREAERLDVERGMLRSQKLESLGLLSGGIAHDFNNLLVGIMGRAELAQDDLKDHALMADHLAQIMDASQHAAGLCQQLLAYSGKGRFLVEPVDLAALVENTQKLIEISIPENVNVQYELGPTPNAIEVDSTQIRQVIMNLVANASDSLQPQGGNIRIGTGTENLERNDLIKYTNGDTVREGLYAYLDVEDSGCGMTSHTMERLFDPFYTTKPDGTGLGMAAVLGIVRSHQGAMSVISDEGTGTTIRVLIPAEAVPAPKVIAPSQPESPRNVGAGMILVVDDEPAIRTVTERILKRAKFDVITADSGTAAIDALNTHKASILAVVLDMKMPDMNGEQAMERLREIRPDLPILLSSGYSEVEITKRLEGKGLSAFLAKPYRSADLINAINDVLSPVD
jgi:PAS domain S-box-containing protein